jgi:hypothetical protein
MKPEALAHVESYKTSDYEHHQSGALYASFHRFLLCIEN